MKPLIIANWKMNFSLEEAVNYTKKLQYISYEASLLIAPPMIYLAHLSTSFKKLNFCSQDVSAFNAGSYTGESSAWMIKGCGVSYSLIGHNERRINLRETNKIIRQKIENCINNGITPIICIGESIETRQNNNFKDFLREQINESIPNISNIIIAYEPVWAIGSGITPSYDEIKEVFNLILTSVNLTSVAKNIRMVYGGSVNSRNYKQILSVPNNTGLLLGTSSLNEEELKNILLN